MTDIGLMTYYLGIKVNQREDEIFISQEGYVREILKKFKMNNKTNKGPYTPPLKALSSQKYRELSQEFSDVGRIASDVTIILHQMRVSPLDVDALTIISNCWMPEYWQEDMEDDMGINEPELVNIVNQIEELEQKIFAHSLHKGASFAECGILYHVLHLWLWVVSGNGYGCRIKVSRRSNRAFVKADKLHLSEVKDAYVLSRPILCIVLGGDKARKVMGAFILGLALICNSASSIWVNRRRSFFVGTHGPAIRQTKRERVLASRLSLPSICWN
ncbi:hypothetical protein ZIOFF_048845 [Zingiber officinale]|uniref:Reverse transcriptase Ty1/copia-type domain-containing protein n=1 Tax=Zingiber officinale TaxID=94328 RepID=A0A8J5G0J5_ZINOF|nr:hypothetical protein ZIOFF_048845 [Zingiber officinale]